MNRKSAYLINLVLLLLSYSNIQAQDGYQIPPDDITNLIDAPLTPRVSLNNSNDWMLLMERPGFPSIEELSQPELKLAGLRINPRTNGSSRSGSYNGLSLTNVESGKNYEVTGLPENAVIENVSWSPNGQKIAFTNTQNKGLSLWILDVKSNAARQVTQMGVNDALRGLPYVWFSDSENLLVRMVVDGRGEAPSEPLKPSGPVISATDGNKAPVRTYQDLLKNPHDEALFKHYFTSQLHLVSTDYKTPATPYTTPGIFTTMSPSPDGNYVLLGRIQEPFSYIVPYSRFPINYELLDRSGKALRTLAEIPAAENIPKGFGAVRMGPRNYSWRDDKAATLTWVEAQDNGDPSMETDTRDQLFSLSAPFSGDGDAGMKFALRYGGIAWGNNNLAISYEWWWNTRQLITNTFNPSKQDEQTVIFEGSFEDRYNDLGDFATHANEYGRQVLLTGNDGKTLYLTGDGASTEGDRPFFRAFNLKDNSVDERWRSEAPYFTRVMEVIDADAGQLIVRRESKEEPPNYYMMNVKTNEFRPLTKFDHPYEALEGIEKQVVQYERKDGVALQGDLYLPKGYKVGEDAPLPVLMWAYPAEFKSADAAGQVDGSPYEFIRLYWGSPLYWLTQGYAILDNPGMPVIGEGEEEPNDSFREQLVANAEAAIDKLVDMGVGDRNRIGVGGHSYGAFMTANLLAHSDLFAAGIARSGAYNRTLTPFGFQSEERTYWDAPEIYYDMSPFMHADKMNEPLLMIHGEADNNSGTFPMQSERYFAALKGLGATARLVMLPHESHGYRAKESILHTLWEMDQWLNKYVKSAVRP